MTTETARAPRDPGTRALVRAAAVAAALGLVLALVAAVTGGSPAAWGALVGTALVLAVFGFGSFSVNAVATVLPAAALLVALLTYTLQVVAMALVFVGLSGSGLLDERIDRAWLAGTLIAGTAAWVVVQVVVATTRRIPVYDLPAAPPAAPSTGTSAGTPASGAARAGAVTGVAPDARRPQGGEG